MADPSETGTLLGEGTKAPWRLFGSEQPQEVHGLSWQQPTPERKPVSKGNFIQLESIPENANGQDDSTKPEAGLSHATSAASFGINGSVIDGGQGRGNVWHPGFFQQFPFRAFLCLLGCLGCLSASISILVRSDGQPTSSWSVSPTVYLALLTSGFNMLARVVFHDGASIAWWCMAVRGGTVRDLHARWAHADGFWAALYATPRHMSFVTLASAAVTVLAVDQPLIQRASTVVAVPRTQDVQVTASLAPEIPWGFTGYQDGRGDYSQVMTQPMIAAFNAFNSQAPITGALAGCEGSCSGYVEAGGLAARCNSTTGPISYELGDFAGQTVSPFSAQFQILEPSENVSSQLVMQIAYTNRSVVGAKAGLCIGLRTERTCHLAPATLRYPVNVTGNTLTITDVLDLGSAVAFQPPAANVTFSTDGTGDFARWTLGGLFLAAQSLFASNASITFGGGIGLFLDLPDTLSNQFLDLTAQSMAGLQNSGNLSVPNACTANWTDPTAHILSSLNTMAFLISMTASSFPYRNTSARPPPQMLIMQQTSLVNVFQSDYAFLVASVLVSFVLVVLILPTFIGWWYLGRSVSLDPLETAKAFDAPLLRGPGSNAPLEQLITIFGSKRVRLGEVAAHADGSETGSTAALNNNRFEGHTYTSAAENHDSISAGEVRRLKMVDAVDAAPPRAGAVYI